MESLGYLAAGLHMWSAIFAVILLSLSLYAWVRRRQPALIVVSAAFLLFFLKIVIEIFPSLDQMTGQFPLDLLLVFIDFATLGLFFAALVLKPKRKYEAKRS
jgi:hypothetical protein